VTEDNAIAKYVSKKTSFIIQKMFPHKSIGQFFLTNQAHPVILKTGQF
jgi:hypothetical protein